MNRFQLQVDDMHCASCSETARRALLADPGVEEASISLQTGVATVVGDINPIAAARIVTASGYPAHPITDTATSAAELTSRMEQQAADNERRWRQRAITALGIWIPMAILHWGGAALGLTGQWVPWVMGVAATAVIVLVGPGFFMSALTALKHRTTNMDTLISIGAGTAWVYSVVLFVLTLAGVSHGQPLYFAEAAALLGLISLGHWMEARASARAGASIRSLLQLQPDTAEVYGDGDDVHDTPVGDVHAGDRLLVRPGGRIPVDGTVIDGISEVDESLITGEPLPVRRAPGDSVVSGSLNTVGRLVVEASVSGGDSTVARIAAMVSDALSSRADIQRVADKVSSIFVPTVLIIAMLTIVGWTITAAVTGNWDYFATGIISAVTVLIISCPCALGLATPMAIMVATGQTGRRGVLIKTAAALEQAGRIEAVVFDKTGTLTEGRPIVSSIVPEGDITEHELLRIAGAAEFASEHPVARAILEAASDRGIDLPEATDFEAIPGQGVNATVEEHQVEVLRDASAACVVTVDGSIIGRIDVEDQPLPDAAAAVTQLRELGLTVEMLSGDRQESAQTIGHMVGIDAASIRAGVTPEEKAAVIRNDTRVVLMVGDGINDAAALAAANVGVAVGSGTNVAIDAADIVIPAHRPTAVALLVRAARLTLRTIHQNLFFAFFYNSVMIPVAAFGLLGPWGPMIAAAAMAASDITVVGNAVRLGRKLRRLPNVGMSGPESA